MRVPCIERDAECQTQSKKEKTSAPLTNRSKTFLSTHHPQTSLPYLNFSTTSPSIHPNPSLISSTHTANLAFPNAKLNSFPQIFQLLKLLMPALQLACRNDNLLLIANVAEALPTSKSGGAWL